MPKTQFEFVLHRLIVHRNKYTEYCYRYLLKSDFFPIWCFFEYAVHSILYEKKFFYHLCISPTLFYVLSPTCKYNLHCKISEFFTFFIPSLPAFPVNCLFKSYILQGGKIPSTAFYKAEEEGKPGGILRSWNAGITLVSCSSMIPLLS